MLRRATRRLTCAGENLEKKYARCFAQLKAKDFGLDRHRGHRIGKKDKDEELADAETFLIAACRALGNIVACDDDDTNRIAAHGFGATKVLCGLIQSLGGMTVGSAALRGMLVAHWVTLFVIMRRFEKQRPLAVLPLVLPISVSIVYRIS